MPEFYSETENKYQKKAQLFLDPIALAIRDKVDARNYLLLGTQHEKDYKNAFVLWREHWKVRDPENKLKCPFWANCFYSPCEGCSCSSSNNMEIDAMFFIRNSNNRRLAIHMEMKSVGDPLSPGQAEAYGPRARCYRDEGKFRKNLLKHDDYITVLVCGSDTSLTDAVPNFNRIIKHDEAREVFDNYPLM